MSVFNMNTQKAAWESTEKRIGAGKTETTGIQTLSDKDVYFSLHQVNIYDYKHYTPTLVPLVGLSFALFVIQYFGFQRTRIEWVWLCGLKVYHLY